MYRERRLRTSTRRRAAIAGLVGVVLALTAACSSSSSSSSGSGTGSSAASPIVIGNIGSYSGQLAPSNVPFAAVTDGWVKMINAQGGINGHPVKLIRVDDGGNATTALTEVKQLVQQDHVVAIVGESSAADETWASYLESTGIPEIGGSPYGIPDSTNPDFFPIGATSATQQYAMVTLAKQSGSRFAFLYCSESPVCAAAGTQLKASAQLLGVDYALQQSVSQTQPNYTAVCQAIKGMNVSAYNVAEPDVVALRIYTQCKQQGVTARPLASGGEASTAFLSSPAVSGLGNVENDFPYFAAVNPATKAYQDFITQYAPALRGAQASENGAHAVFAYLSFELFEAAVKAAPSGPITAASIKQGLYSLKNETLGGLAPQLNFVKGQPTSVNCWFTSSINDGKWALPNGLKTQCAPSSDIAEVQRAAG